MEIDSEFIGGVPVSSPRINQLFPTSTTFIPSRGTAINIFNFSLQFSVFSRQYPEQRGHNGSDCEICSIYFVAHRNPTWLEALCTDFAPVQYVSSIFHIAHHLVQQTYTLPRFSVRVIQCKADRKYSKERVHDDFRMGLVIMSGISHILRGV